MSQTLLTGQAEPSTPASGKTLQYVDTEGRSRTKNSTGIVNLLSGEDPINYILNAGFWFAQRQVPGTLTTYSNVGGRVYSADRWCLSNENASTQYRRVDTSGAVESGLTSRYFGEFTKITANGKIQIMQAIEGSNACQIRTKNIRIQLKMKSVVAASAQWNIALVQLTQAGTIDTIPSGAGLFFTAQGGAGVDPTLGANLAYIAPTAGKAGDNCTAGANSYAATVTTTWQRFGGVFTVPSNCKNLILVIYSQNQVTTTNGVAISEVTMTEGEEIQDWSPRPVGQELQDCQRYYTKSFAIDTAPAQNAGLANAIRGHVAVAAAVAAPDAFVRFPVTMRAAPTLAYFNPSAANAFLRNVTAGTDATATATGTAGENGTDVSATGLAAWTIAQSTAVHFTADAEA